MNGMNKHHLSPYFYVGIALLTVLLAVLVFKRYGHHDEYYFIPIFALGIMWSIANFRRQSLEPGYFCIDKKSSFIQLSQRSLARYVVWFIIFFIGISFYESHPYYKNYVKSIEFIQTLFDLYIYFGLVYFYLTLKFKSSRTEDYYDTAIRLIHIVKQLLLGILSSRARRQPFAVFKNKYNRKVVLNLIMRGYFIPIMVIQVFNGFKNTMVMSTGDFSNYHLLTFLLWLTGILWLADALAASTGYCLESRWMENRSRSIDLTVGGWLVCLASYAPINQATSTLFPFAPSIITNNPNDLLFSFAGFFIALKIIELVLLSSLVFSDLSLGPSGVNITLKKLQTRGPYSIIRHPATVCKITLWWMQSLFYIQFWNLEIILGQLMWNVLYILRALTEERHLSHYPEYRAYKEKVRYRFIPGVI